MMKKPVTTKAPAAQVVKDIRRATRKLHSSEEKIRIVLSGLRREDSIAELCRKEGIAQSLYYSWSKEFLEAGKKRLAGDPGHRLHARIKALALEDGLICYPMGGTIDGRRGDHVLLAPPFIIESAEIDELVTKLARAIDRATTEIPDRSVVA